MFSSSHRACGLLLSCLLACGAGMGCFSPNTQEGLSCSPSGACPTGQSCSGGTCYQVGNVPSLDAAVDATTYECTAQTLAGGQGGATALDALDADHVYWTAAGGTVVLRSPKVVGAVAVFHDSGLGLTPSSVATDDTAVYWTENDALGRVVRKAKDSLTADPVIELAVDQQEPHSLVLDATHVYWTNTVAGTVSRVPKGGGTVEEVAVAQGSPTVLSIDETRLYWVNSATGQIMRANKDGTALQQLAGAQGNPADITISDDTVFWAVNEDNEVRSVGKDGGAVNTLLTGQMGVSDLTVGGAHLYWSSDVSGDILRQALGESESELVVEEQSEAVSLHFTDTLYWLNSLDSTNRLVRASCNSL